MGAPDHSVGSSVTASVGTNTPLSLRTEFLFIPTDDTHIPSPLCASPRGDGVGSAAASTPPPVPSPVIPSGVIRSVRRYSIIFVVVAVVVVVVVVALEISTIFASYHQLSPPNQKIVFFSCFVLPI